MRSTIHMVAAPDYAPFTAAVREARRAQWLRADEAGRRAGHAGRRRGRAPVPGGRPAQAARDRRPAGRRRVPEGRVGGRAAVGRPAARAARRHLGQAAGAPVRPGRAGASRRRDPAADRGRAAGSCSSPATCGPSGRPPPADVASFSGCRSRRSAPCSPAATCAGSAARRAGSWSTCRTRRCPTPTRRRRCASWAPGTRCCSCTPGAPRCCPRPTGRACSRRRCRGRCRRSSSTARSPAPGVRRRAGRGQPFHDLPAADRPCGRRRRPSGSRPSTRRRDVDEHGQGRRMFVVDETRARSSASWRSPS